MRERTMSFTARAGLILKGDPNVMRHIMCTTVRRYPLINFDPNVEVMCADTMLIDVFNKMGS